MIKIVPGNTGKIFPISTQKYKDGGVMDKHVLYLTLFLTVILQRITMI